MYCVYCVVTCLLKDDVQFLAVCPIIFTERKLNVMGRSETCGLHLINKLLVVLEQCNAVIILWIEVVCDLQVLLKKYVR